jgi:hypothetical protein
LCWGHHAALHDGFLTITGRAPYDLVFRWKYGPPPPVDATVEEREAARLEKLAVVFGEPVERPELEIPARFPRGKSLRTMARDVPAGIWPPAPVTEPDAEPKLADGE